MTEDEVFERLYWDFTNDLCERLKYVKLCHKDDLDGDNDNLLWHFTRLSVFKNMLSNRQLWLTDLALSNDKNEIIYGLNRAPAVVDRVCQRWTNKLHAAAVRHIADSALRRFSSEFHVFAFCLSDERDTAQHWNEYGGGLHSNTEPDDPYVAIGFDAQSLFYPIEFSGREPEAYIINTVNGDDSADHLVRYWAIKARKMLEVLEDPLIPLSRQRALDALERMLVIACSLIKNEGWRDEHEYRLLYITEKFGEEEGALPPRADGRGRYVPLGWSLNRMPIRMIMPHPLADAEMVKQLLHVLPGGRKISVIRSALRPRPKQDL
jgi:hypothetical protein